MTHVLANICRVNLLNEDEGDVVLLKGPIDTAVQVSRTQLVVVRQTIHQIMTKGVLDEKEWRSPNERAEESNALLAQTVARKVKQNILIHIQT